MENEDPREKQSTQCTNWTNSWTVIQEFVCARVCFMMIQTPQKRPYSVADHQIRVLYINIARIVLNCQRCKECLNVHKSLGLLFETVLKMSLPLSLSLYLHLLLSFCWSGHVSSSLWSYGSRDTRNSFPVFTAPNLSMQMSQTRVINPQSLWALLLLPEDLEVTDSKVSVVSLTALRTFAVDSYFL